MQIPSASQIVACLILAGVLGCGETYNSNDESPPPVSVRNGRLAFESAKALYETVSQLDKMNQEELDIWEAKFPIDSYQRRFASPQQYGAKEQSPNDEEFYKFPSSYRAIINTNGEVQVGEDILWYNDGNIYSVPAYDEARLQEIKRDPSRSSPTGKYSITLVSDDAHVNSDSRSAQTVGIGIFNGLDARHQHEFYWWGNLRKYVHELYSYTQALGLYDPLYGNGYSYGARLYMRLKLEWRGRRSWKPASEPRSIQYNITYRVGMCNLHIPPFKEQSQCNTGFFANTFGSEVRSTDWDVILAEATGVQFTGWGDPYWVIELSGSITQHIQGDPSTTPWINSGSPLW